MRPAAIAAVALALSGCATYEAVLATQRPPTEAEKAAIVHAARNHLPDPGAVGAARISNVVKLNDHRLEAVCVTARITDAASGQSVEKTVSVRLFEGKVISSLEGATFCADGRMPYEPFPELAAIPTP